MKTILASTAIASLIAVTGVLASPSAFAQDNQPCVGESCPGTGMPGGDQGTTRKQRPAATDSQGTEDQSGQMPMRKKRIQGSANDNQMQEEQQLPRRKRAHTQSNDNNVDVNVDVGTQRSARRGDWRFDPSRHERRRSKSATFRFFYGGYWYPQPYWEVYTVRSRGISCGEGRAIVSERFSRVRVVECNGGTYTYLGRRQGDTYRILLNARTGRIIGRALI